MIAAWQVRPPRLVTIAAARFITGSQSGSVMSATSTSPLCTRVISLTSRMMRAGPAPMRWPIERPLDEHLRLALEREALHGAAGAALHGFGPRLQDVDLAGLAVLAPLDVHRAAVVLLDDQRLLGELDDVVVGDREAPAIFGGDIDRRDALVAAGRRRTPS